MNNKDYVVFFVDDEPTVCKAVEVTLAREQYTVRSFTAAAACLDALKSHPCDLLITDVNMPEIGGIELVRTVRQRHPLLPLLVITGYGSIPLAVAAMQAGAVDFIEKPLDREVLLAKIETGLQQSVRCKLEKLTKAELRILDFLVAGKSNKEIAQVQRRSTRTVEDHRFRIMHKLGVDNIVELIKLVSKDSLNLP